jgi:hypothetical protein
VFTRCHRRMPLSAVPDSSTHNLNFSSILKRQAIPPLLFCWSLLQGGPSKRYLPRLPNYRLRCPPIPDAGCEHGLVDGEGHARCMAPHPPPTCPSAAAASDPHPGPPANPIRPRKMCTHGMTTRGWVQRRASQPSPLRLGAAGSAPSTIFALRASAAEHPPCACLWHVCRSLKARGQARQVGEAQAAGADAAVADTAPQGFGTALRVRQLEHSLQCTESMLDEPQQQCAACRQQAAEATRSGAGVSRRTPPLRAPPRRARRLSAPRQLGLSSSGLPHCQLLT